MQVRTGGVHSFDYLPTSAVRSLEARRTATAVAVDEVFTRLRS